MTMRTLIVIGSCLCLLALGVVIGSEVWLYRWRHSVTPPLVSPVMPSTSATSAVK